MQSIIITGATSGIGFECALQLARMAPDKQLIIACHSQPAGDQALQVIKKQTHHPNLICLPLELESLQSVRDFVRLFAQLPHHRICTLVNNAGMQNVGETRYTEDGVELTFGVNVLAPFYLTLLLLPFMEAGSHITFTASGTHDPNQKTGMPAPVYTHAERLAHPQKPTESTITTGQRRYTTSKLCTILTVYTLQKHVQPLTIRVNAFDPGLVPGTGLARNYPWWLKFISDYVFKLLILVHPNVHTAKQSGINLANLAYAEAFRNYEGTYVEGANPVPSSADSYRHDFQEDLWETLIRLTRLKPEQTSISLS